MPFIARHPIIPAARDDVLMVEFTLMGGMHRPQRRGQAQHSEAFSFQIATETQEETDRYWEALTADGGAGIACSWCKDRWGLRWQIVPRVLGEGW
jgi:2-polyprenyl-6-hydroxyphenyl methylase/3-demethylubiquinone-9 3-methyltransferase